MTKVEAGKPVVMGAVTSASNGGHSSKLWLGPRIRLTLLIVGCLILLGAVTTGGYMIWRHFHPAKQPQPAKVNNEAVTKQQYAKDVQNIKVPDGVDKSGVLRVQMGATYNAGDYAGAVSYAKALLAQPGYGDDIDALHYLALASKQLGDTAQEKQAYQKIITYLDAHTDLKASTYGQNMYNEAKAGVK